MHGSEWEKGNGRRAKDTFIMTTIMDMAIGCPWRYSDGEYSGVNM